MGKRQIFRRVSMLLVGVLALNLLLSVFGLGEKKARAAVATNVVISQIFGGGSKNDDSAYKYGFVELYNPTNADIDLTGWTVQIVSNAAGTGSTWSSTELGLKTKKIPAHGYYLVKEGTTIGEVVRNAITTELPASDTDGTIQFSNTNGKVALVNSTNLLTTQNPSNDASVIDFVGYGSADAYKVAKAAATSAKKSIFRKALNPEDLTGLAVDPLPGGIGEFYGSNSNTGDNSIDFVVTSASGYSSKARNSSIIAPLIKGTVDSNDNTVAMSSARTVSQMNNTFRILLTPATGIVGNRSLNPGQHYFINGLPNGLSSSAVSAAADNSITFTISGTATNDITSNIDITASVYSAALSNPIYGNSIAIGGIRILPVTPKITGSVFDGTSGMSTPTMPDSTNTFSINLENGTIRNEALIQGVDYTITGLPDGLTTSAVGDSANNRITFKVEGTALSYVFNESILTVTLLVHAVEAGGSATQNSDPITDITISRYSAPVVSDTGRTAWLKQDIIAHNSFYNDFGIKDRKYKEMYSGGTSAFAYYRATNDIFYRDLGTIIPVPSVWSTTYQNLTTWIQGDAHAQNMGFFDYSQGNVIYDLNDFDASIIAPFYWDLIRYGTSAYLANDDSATIAAANKLSYNDIRLLAKDFMDQYYKELKWINNNSVTAATYELTADHLGGFVLGLYNNSITTKAGNTNPATKYADYLNKWASGGAGPLSNGDKLAPTSDSEKYEITSNWSEYMKSTDYYKTRSTDSNITSYFKILDIATRVDQGLGSRGLKRYYVLIEGPTSNASDNIVLDVKEAGATDVKLNNALNQSDYDNLGVEDSDALRIIQGTKAMQLNVDNNVGVLKSAVHSFVVRKISPNKYDITDSKLSSMYDFSNYLTYSAQALALAHSRSTANFAHDIVTTFNDAQWTNFRLGLVNLAEDYYKQVTSDYTAIKASLNDSSLVKTVNAQLSELVISGPGVTYATYQPAANQPSTLNYFVEVPKRVTSINIKATLTQNSISESSVIAINGAAATNGVLKSVPLTADEPVKVEVKASNGFVQAYLIYLKKVPTSPTNLSLSANSIAENSAVGSNIGSFTTTDLDMEDTFTYTLVSGSGSEDNSKFSINGSALKTAAVFDYETKSSYGIRVRVTNSSNNTFEKAFTVNITDVNENTGGSSPSSPPSQVVTPKPSPTVTPSATTSAVPTETPKPIATPTPSSEGSIKPKEVVEVKLADDAIQATKETGSNGKETTKITLDEQKLAQALQTLNNSNNNSTDTKSKLVIELKGENTSSQMELSASVLANAAKSNSDAIVTLKSGNASYDLPLQSLSYADLAKELGIPQDQLKINVHMNPVDQKTANQLQAAANETGRKLISGTFDFSVTAEGNGKSIEIHVMGQSYTERSINVSSDVDTDHSTGIRFDPETGKTYFVPTVFETTVDGQTVATLKRKGNSIYTVIESSRIFSDLNGHWAKKDIEMLASKQIISGKTKTAFAPNAKITRAEFASLLVRALGLNTTSTEIAYSDVSAKDWYYNDVATAFAEGIITGVGNGRFNPNGLITREEMAVMIMRAMKTAGKPVGVNPVADQTLSAFNDANIISSWSKQSVAQAVASGLLQGVDKNSFVPQDTATRAQAAVLLKRFLQKAEFIN